MARSAEEKRAYLREYYRENKHKWAKRSPEKQAEYNANRRAKYAQDPEHRDKIKEKIKEFWQANPRKKKAGRVKAFGLTIEAFEAMLEAQGGKCAICGHDDKGNLAFFPHIDHCHETGIVRGILCMNCNHGVGKFKDSPDLLRKAAEYLEASNAKRQTD